MKYSSIKAEIEKLKRIESDYEKIISGYRKEKDVKIISSPCFFVPPEIIAAFGIITLKIPEFFSKRNDYAETAASFYDAFVIPDKNCICNTDLPSSIPVYTFKIPSGYGEDAAVALHNEISAMLKTIFGIEIKSINIETLQGKTAVYEKLRRMVRNICDLRSVNRNLLSNKDLSLVFETALILPPETAIEFITPVIEEIKKLSEKDENKRTRAMMYCGRNIPSDIADSIEEKGFIIVEDDSCTGRRSFDMSLNSDSEYIFYEILDSYSYRPLTPCMRPVNERYELLYKLLKNYNIETVIFFKDNSCDYSSNDINYLRIRMMRDGIDPLVIDNKNYSDVISYYINNF